MRGRAWRGLLGKGWSWVEKPVWFSEEKFNPAEKQEAAEEEAEQTGVVFPPSNYFGNALVSDQDSFCDIVDDWKAKLSGAFDLCMPHKTPQAERVQGAWIAEQNVPVSAYRPSAWPYFLSYDRGTMHSWWTDTQQKVHLKRPGVPLMQII